MTIQELAKEARAQFTRSNRSKGPEYLDGDAYWHTTSGADPWIVDLVHEAHQSHPNGFLPDDYRYQFIIEALGAIADGDTDGESLEPTVYTGERTAWLASNLLRVGYCDEAISEYVWDAKSGLDALLGMGMYAELREVFESVKHSLEEELTNR